MIFMYRDELQALRARNETLTAELELERRRRQAAEAETEAIRAATREARLRPGAAEGPVPLPRHLLTVAIAILSTITMIAFIWAADQRLRAHAAMDRLHACEKAIQLQLRRPVEAPGPCRDHAVLRDHRTHRRALTPINLDRPPFRGAQIRILRDER
jgi:hypothetical protein